MPKRASYESSRDQPDVDRRMALGVGFGESTVPFIDIDTIPALELLPGCRLRTPYGQNIMLSYLEMDAGAEVPLHHHPHEQAGMLLKGRMELTIGDETRVVEAGSMFIIPPNTPHRAVAAGGPALVLDVFSPVREDYAELFNKYIPTP
jgi:quercetin dioxygenase-like cupin family protein